MLWVILKVGIIGKNRGRDWLVERGVEGVRLRLRDVVTVFIECEWVIVTGNNEE